METSINRQPLFSNKATRESFREMPPKKIQQYSRKLRSRKNIKPAWRQNKTEILVFFDDLILAKKRIEKHTRMLHLLESDASSLSARQLLEIMFEVVFRHMYREEWKLTSADLSELLPASKGNGSLRSTANEARKWQVSV